MLISTVTFWWVEKFIWMDIVTTSQLIHSSDPKIWYKRRWFSGKKPSEMQRLKQKVFLYKILFRLSSLILCLPSSSFQFIYTTYLPLFPGILAVIVFMSQNLPKYEIYPSMKKKCKKRVNIWSGRRERRERERRRRETVHADDDSHRHPPPLTHRSR